MAMDIRLRMAATVAVLGAVGGMDDMTTALGIDTSQPALNLYRGRICGRDNGKPAVRTQPRNSPCVCGSGKKAKKCCVVFPKD